MYLQVVWSDYSEASTYSLRSSASLPGQPVNHAVQHLREFNQNPGVSQAIDFNEFSSVISLMCLLLITRIKMLLDCADKKEFEFYLLDNPHRLK